MKEEISPNPLAELFEELVEDAENEYGSREKAINLFHKELREALNQFENKRREEAQKRFNVIYKEVLWPKKEFPHKWRKQDSENEPDRPIKIDALIKELREALKYVEVKYRKVLRKPKKEYSHKFMGEDEEMAGLIKFAITRRLL